MISVCGRYKVSTLDDCINCIDVGLNNYCRSNSNLTEGMCCNSIFDFNSANCMES